MSTPAVAEGGPFLVGFGDLCLERDDTLEPVMYLSHEGHSAPWAAIGIHRVRRSRLSRMASTPDPDELAALRREYGDSGLDDPDLAADPVAMFRHWMHDAVVAGLHEPNAMVVATVSARGPPVVPDGAAQGRRRARLRLLHQLRLAQGPRPRRPTRRCALLFPWHDLQRQVRVEGRAEPGLAARRAQALLRHPAARLPARRLGLAAVERGGLPRRAASGATREVEERFAGHDVPLPPNWGGFRVVPEARGVLAGEKGPDARPARLPRDGEGWATSGWRRRVTDPRSTGEPSPAGVQPARRQSACQPVIAAENRL